MKGVDFRYQFEGDGSSITVEGNTSSFVSVTGWGGVRFRGEEQTLNLSFDEASVLRALLTQALFLRQEEQRDDG